MWNGATLVWNAGAASNVQNHKSLRVPQAGDKSGWTVSASIVGIVNLGTSCSPPVLL